MEWDEKRLLNRVTRPQIYEEVIIYSKHTPIVLSVWHSSPKDPCIIFLPGTMCHPLYYEDFLDGLAQGGYNVIGIHFLSHGKSPRIKVEFTLEDFLENIRDTISYTLERFKTPICLMGSSQGGILASYVSTIDERIGLAFCHSVCLPSQEEAINVTRFPQWLKGFRSTIDKGVELIARGFPTLQIPMDLYLDPKKITANSHKVKEITVDPMGIRVYPLSFIHSLFTLNIDPRRVKCPLIVMTTSGDEVFSEDYIKSVYEQFEAPAKELLIIPEGGHLCLIEKGDLYVAPVLEKLGQYLN